MFYVYHYIGKNRLPTYIFLQKKKKNQVWNIANENETIINGRKLAAVNNGFDFIG